MTWVLCPVLACVFSILLYFLIRSLLGRIPLHIFRQDVYTRWALILVGAFGSYSLGANNIANVMGVFVESVPFNDISIAGLIPFTKAQQLFFIGSIAIAVGVFTYSKRVMSTVGSGIFKLSPVTSFIVVLASSLVLFIFASKELQQLMISLRLPPIPLVPVSSSQAVVGAVIGIGIAKGGKSLKFNALGRIVIGWITTPVIAAILCFILLYFMQNVFTAEVYVFAG